MKSKDNYDEKNVRYLKKCNAIFMWRFNYFFLDSDIDIKERNTIKALLDSVKKKKDYEIPSELYNDCFEINETIKINDEDHKVTIIYSCKEKKPLFFDIFKFDKTYNVEKYDKDKDYFFKFKGQINEEPKCPICGSNSKCMVEVNLVIEYDKNGKSFERAYLISTCNNKSKFKNKNDGIVKEKELRAVKLKEK